MQTTHNCEALNDLTEAAYTEGVAAERVAQALEIFEQAEADLVVAHADLHNASEARQAAQTAVWNLIPCNLN